MLNWNIICNMNQHRPKDAMYLAAYYLLLGWTKTAVATELKRSVQTIIKWTQRDDWGEIRDHATQMFLGETMAVARRALLAQLQTNDGDLALKVLERMHPGFEPAAQRIHFGMDIDEAQNINEELDQMFANLESGDAISRNTNVSDDAPIQKSVTREKVVKEQKQLQLSMLV